VDLKGIPRLSSCVHCRISLLVLRNGRPASKKKCAKFGKWDISGNSCCAILRYVRFGRGGILMGWGWDRIFSFRRLVSPFKENLVTLSKVKLRRFVKGSNAFLGRAGNLETQPMVKSVTRVNLLRNSGEA
jgi:hypothetical protein